MVFPTAAMATGFGIAGNIVSFMVYLAPLPTFIRIYRKKSTQGFQSIPYSVSLFSAMLYLYYAYIKKNMMILITINSIGCAVQCAYLLVFMIYATKEARIFTTKMLIGLNFIAYGLIVVSTIVFFHDFKRVTVVGWICSVFSVCVFAAPLSIMMKVIKTKSVEFMPFSLSLSLTLCAVMWFFYGFLIKDYYVATPNVLGFAFGTAQMILYAIYRRSEQQVLPEINLKELAAAVTVIEIGADTEAAAAEKNPDACRKSAGSMTPPAPAAAAAATIEDRHEIQRVEICV